MYCEVTRLAEDGRIKTVHIVTYTCRVPMKRAKFIYLFCCFDNRHVSRVEVENCTTLEQGKQN